MDSKELAREIAREGYSTGVFHSKAFERDFNVFLTSKKMVTRFIRTGKVNEKLLINNVVTSLNIFGSKKTNAIFRLMLDDVQFSVVKAILMFLHQYDFSISPGVYPNRIVVDMLRDMSLRYNLEHL